MGFRAVSVPWMSSSREITPQSIHGSSRSISGHVPQAELSLCHPCSMGRTPAPSGTCIGHCVHPSLQDRDTPEGITAPCSPEPASGPGSTPVPEFNGALLIPHGSQQSWPSWEQPAMLPSCPALLPSQCSQCIQYAHRCCSEGTLLQLPGMGRNGISGLRRV